MSACVGCGFECRRAPCGFSNYQMREDELTWDKTKGCPYLRQVGIQWRCGMYLDAGPELRKTMEIEMGIGAGCSSSLFNTERELMIRRLRFLSNSSSPSPGTSSDSNVGRTE